MKKKLAVLLILVVALIICGCGINSKSVLTENCINQEGIKSFSSSYDLFDGKREYTINAESVPLRVDIEITSVSGSIDIEIKKGTNKAEYTGKDVPTSAFSVILNESGLYTVKITAKQHKGAYSFAW